MNEVDHEIVEDGDEEKNIRKTDRAGLIISYFFASIGAILLLLYLTVSDLHPIGEFLTIWPPILWFVPAFVISIPLMFKGDKWSRITLGSIVFLFGIILIEWGSIVRGIVSSPPEINQKTVRIITWNIGGGYPSREALLDEIAGWEPDLVLFQESPFQADYFTSQTLTGYFDGFYYADGGDCAMLSRWPMTVLETDSVGPWDKPQIVRVELDKETSWLVTNVRLMLPSLVLNPFDSQTREKLWKDNKTRREQYPELLKLIKNRQSEFEYDATILAGDFNTDSSARSLDVIEEEFIDTWKQSGVGWGGTVTNQFPAARIDHIYAQELNSQYTKVLKTTMSDHRPVLSVLDRSSE